MSITDDLPLFITHTQPQHKLAARWEECKRDHPKLLHQLYEIALRAKRKGYQHWSMDAAFHVLRWETSITTGRNDGLKVNNNFSAFAARDLMKRYPDLEGFFQLRKQRPRAASGQLH